MNTVNHIAPESDRYLFVNERDLIRIPMLSWATRITYWKEGEERAETLVHYDEMEGRKKAVQLAEEQGVLVQYATLSSHHPLAGSPEDLQDLFECILMVDKVTVTPAHAVGDVS